MKKIMFGLAAAIAMVAAADIESSNIVGYQMTDSVAGFNFYSPMFKPVGADAVKIQAIKLVEGATAWADNIQVLDEGGATIAQYYYATADESGLDDDGWMTPEGDALADVTLAAGQSVIVETSDVAVIQNAGEVARVASDITGVAGFNFVGNSSPANISIQQVKLGEGATSWADNIQILDEGGATVAQYYYAAAEESGLDSDGWMTPEGDALAEITLKPGQGIIVETAEAGVKITLPSAL